MDITTETQNVIHKYIKDKKYITETGTLKVSFQDVVVLIVVLQDEYNRTKDPKIRTAIAELDYKRFD